MMEEEVEINLKEIIEKPWFIPAAIVLLVLATRLPLININQALWWDESQYMLIVKSNLLGTPTTGWWEGRGLFYPNLLTLVTIMGYSELPARLLNILFAAGIALYTYYLFKELYKKKELAIATAIIITFQWVIIFYSFRILRDIPAAFFIIASNYYFIKSFNSKKKRFTNYSLLSGGLLALGFLVRSTHGLVGLAYLAYTLYYYKFKKKYYTWLLGAVIVFGLISIPDTIFYGNPLHSTIKEALYHLEKEGGAQTGPPTYYLTSYVYNYGWIIALFTVPGIAFLALKPLKKQNFFILLNMIPYFLAYSVLTQVKEIRFLIHLSPFLVFTAVYGAKIVARLFTKNKQATSIVLGLVVFFSLLYNISYGYQRVYESSSSYYEIKQIGEYLKDTGINTTIMTQSVPQITYYSELPAIKFPKNESDFIQTINDNNVGIVIVSLHEKYPEYAYNLSGYNLTPLIAIPENEPTLISLSTPLLENATVVQG